jgi:hypothetical protein
VGERVLERVGDLEALDAPRALSTELVALDEPGAGGLAADLGDEDEARAEEHVGEGEHLLGRVEERAAHALVEFLWPLPRGAVAELAVAVAHQAVEELAETHRAA